MTILELSSLIAMILTVEGNTLKVDKGLIDGLRYGDVGGIYYSLTVGSEKKRIEVAKGYIVQADDLSATVRAFLQDSTTKLPSYLKIRPGYRIEFHMPPDRVSIPALLEVSRLRLAEGKFDEALLYFHRIRELVPEDAFIQKQIDEIQRKKNQHNWLKRELGKLDYYREAARGLFAKGEVGTARLYVKKILRLTPDDDFAQKLQKELERRTTPADMVLVPGGIYEIGVNLSQANFYNQHPRFSVNLKSFLIDLKPVNNSASAKFKPDFTFAEVKSNSPVTDASFADAEGYCKWLGKRLPTEFEWEVAVQNPEVKRVLQVSEWTSSCYQPYPGNVIWGKRLWRKIARNSRY